MQFSLEREIPIDAFVTGISSIDEGLFKYGYPLFVSCEMEERFIIGKLAELSLKLVLLSER